MDLLKCGGVSVVYVCIVQLIHGIVLNISGDIAGGAGAGILNLITAVAFIIPVVVMVVRALKINNLYNIRRFALEGIKKNILPILLFVVILFFIGSNCYVGYNVVNIFLTQINITNATMLAFYYFIFDDGISYVFVCILTLLGLISKYNLPLTGNER